MLTSIAWECAIDLICCALTFGLKQLQAGWQWSRRGRELINREIRIQFWEVI